MAKISSIVIPATIDTSGIDRGISQIRNKLSRVRGGGTGVGGGGTGFTSGVTPFGGGGDLGGAAMAAAFGAVAASRSRMAASVHTRAGLGQAMNVPVPAIVKRATFNGQPMHPNIAAFGGDFDTVGQQTAAWKYSRSRIASAFYGMKTEQTGSLVDLDRQKRRTAIAEQRFRAQTYADSRLGKMLDPYKQRYLGAERSAAMMASSKVGSIVGGAGIGAGIYAAVRGAGSRQMEQRSSDIARFRGTSYYTGARNLKADYYNTSTPTASQGFFMGGRMGTGGRAPIIERAYTALGDVPSGVATAAGLAIGGAEAAISGTPAEQAASTKATQDFYSGTNVSMGGPIVIGLEKLFRKIFM